MALPMSGADDAKPNLRFRTAAVERGSVTATVQATGTLQPQEVVDVGAQVAGKIVKLGVDPRDKNKTIDFGAEVDKDTLLAQIDPERYQLEVDQAKANVQQAEADLQLATVQLDAAERAWERVQKLKDAKAIAADDIDKAKTVLEIARATLVLKRAGVQVAQTGLRKAETDLRYCDVRSPIKGVIIDRRVNLGQTVAASLTAPSLFMLARDLTKLEIWATVNEVDVGDIRVGQDVHFTVDAFAGKSFKGKVVPQGKLPFRLNATMNQNVVTYTAIVNVDNSDGKLLPYLTADCRFQVGERKNVLLVPNPALRWRPQLAQVAADARDAYAKMLANDAKDDKDRAPQHLVWVEDKGFVRPVKVRIGLSDGRRTEIVQGDLAEGQQIVTGVRPPAVEGDKGPGAAAANDILDLTLVLPRDSQSRLTIQDVTALTSGCPAIAAAAPVVRARERVTHGSAAWTPLYIYGTTSAHLDVRNWADLHEGEVFDDRAVRQSARVCLIGQTLARELFGSASPIGSSVRVGTTAFRVIGVLSPKGQNFIGFDQDDLLIAPWTTIKQVKSASAPLPAGQLYEGLAGATAAADKGPPPDVIDQILVRPTSPDETAAAARQITEVLRRRHRIRAGQPDDFSIRDMSEMRKALAR